MFKYLVIVFSFVIFIPLNVRAIDILCDGHRDKSLDVMAGYGKPLTIETLLIDPQGRKTGFDPETKSEKKEIPCSGYADDYYGGDVPPVQVLVVNPTIDGPYSLLIYSPTSTPYSLAIYISDESREDLKIETTGILSGGAVAEYKINYDSSSVNNSTVTPELFDGKGQRPVDVNTFLAYAGPTQGRTNLTAGQTTYDVAIYYGETIQPGTFKATLNSADITGSFNPEAGKSELVTIPLQIGRNTLILSVNGIRNDGRKATDTDSLVFIVP